MTHCSIILDAAYSLNDRVFADNLGTILIYAIVVRNVYTCWICDRHVFMVIAWVKIYTFFLNGVMNVAQDKYIIR